jgi:hypothetical protein
MRTPTSDRNIRRRPQRSSLGGRHPKRQGTKCPLENVTDGLSHFEFLPVAIEGAGSRDNWQAKEGEFFNSLSFLAELYGFEAPRPDIAPYPRNISLALDFATQQVQKVRPSIELMIIEDDAHLATISTYLQMSTGSDLYYIPQEPLHRLLELPKRKREANLLLSIFAYLHQVLRIDTFTDESSYLYYYYDMMRTPDFIDGRHDLEEIMDETTKAFKGGKKIAKRMRQRVHLRDLEARTNSFRTTSPTTSTLHDLAVQATKLYRDYPDRSIHPSIPSYVEPPYDEYQGENDPIQSQQYLSFCWEYDGVLAESVVEWVNLDLQEAMGCDEPLNYQLFDQPQTAISVSLDFEERVFALLSSLCYYLINTLCIT